MADSEGHRAAVSRLRVWRAPALLAMLVLLSHAYFYNGAQWNHNARFDTVFATVEGHRPLFAIDPFIVDAQRGVNTGDWSFFQGHYYSNKAPGPALLGIPVYALLSTVERALGVDPTANQPALLNAYFIHLAVTVLPLALASIFGWFLFKGLSGSRTSALLCALVLFWGTLLLPYATQLWGHCSAAAGVLIAFAAFERAGRIWPLVCGAAAGWATLCEYSCGIVVVALGVGYLVRRDWVSAARFAIGGVPAAALFGWYHTVCFGAPWRIANQFINPLFRDQAGLFSQLQPGALAGLTIGADHGLLVFSPVFVLVPFGVTFLWRSDHRPLCMVVLLSLVGFAAMNMTFNGWHGGHCIGPRYQIPVLAGYVILLAKLPAWKWLRSLTVGLWAVGALNMATATWFSASFDPAERRPPLQTFRQWTAETATGMNRLHPYPGQIRLQPRSFQTKLQHFNWGELLGLSGLASILPWIALTTGGWWLLWRDVRSGAG